MRVEREEVVFLNGGASVLFFTASSSSSCRLNQLICAMFLWFISFCPESITTSLLAFAICWMICWYEYYFGILDAIIISFL